MQNFALSLSEVQSLNDLQKLAKRYKIAEGESPFKSVGLYSAVQLLVDYTLSSGGNLPVINNTGSTIAKAKAVAFGGIDVVTGRVKIVLADKSVAGGQAIGVLEDALVDGATGTLRSQFDFPLSGLNVAGPPSAGAFLYLGTSGNLSTSAAAGEDINQVVAVFVAEVGTSDTIRVQIQPPSAVNNRIAVINNTGGILAKAKAVAFGGIDVTTGRVKIVLADKSNPYGQAIGVLEAAIADGATGTLRSQFDFPLSGLDVAGPPAAGDFMYLGNTGDLTTTAPRGTDILQVVAVFVANVGASDTIRVQVQPPIMTSNAIKSGSQAFAGGGVVDSLGVGAAFDGCPVAVCIESQAAAAYVVSAIIAAGTLTVTFSVDPGVSVWNFIVDGR